ncbi:MAG: hypothetical protein MMC23_001671 [Stictis urceolatum]|nr:hypothetical protein [Stictis urceolata]
MSIGQCADSFQTSKQSCWPKEKTWSSLNRTVSGHLVKSVPVAQSCYPGPLQDAIACAEVDLELTDSTFIAANSIALGYPLNPACAPINITSGQVPVGKCELGDVPLYSVDARSANEVAEGVKFAGDHNIRLVVRNTGHDILGRSTGYGSMQVWLHNLRDGINFQQKYKPSDQCQTSQMWTGSAMTVGGGYVWGEIYPMAAQNNVVVVGGGDPSVGISGGWMQGGGHSPASRDFGLGADQLLEATVVTADGKIVTASPCQNQDLFFALRGGGGGSYGVITSATIKAHPTPKVIAQTLAIAPLSSETMDDFMEAVAILYESYPSLFQAGYSGYGTWSIASPLPLFANFTTGFTHAIAMFGKSEQQAKDAFAPVGRRLSSLNASLVISTNYIPFPSYAEYYSTLSGVQSAVGTSSALGSRLLDKQALTQSPEALRDMLKITAGRPEESTSNNICLVAPAPGVGEDKYSGVNPAWRGAVVHNIVARGWAPGSDQNTIDAVHKDITYNKNMAQARLAPNTGCYMNEADRLDPAYEKNFYGSNLGMLQDIKKKVDPKGVFYCPTCVGSSGYVVDDTGAICEKGK